MSEDTGVVVVLSYDCGCGFRTTNFAKATDHAELHRHNLTVHGRIMAEKLGEEKVVVR